MTFHLVTQAKNLAAILNYLLFLIPIFGILEMEYGIWNIGYWLCPYNRSQTWPYLKPPPTFKPPSALALTIIMAFWQLPCSQSGPSIVCSSHNSQSDLSKREIRPWSSLAQNLPVASYCSYNRRYNPIQVLEVHCIWTLLCLWRLSKSPPHFAHLKLMANPRDFLLTWPHVWETHSADTCMAGRRHL